MKKNYISLGLKFLKAWIRRKLWGRDLTREEVKLRRETCYSCPMSEMRINMQVHCNDCGCELKKKTKWSTEQCPQDKW